MSRLPFEMRAVSDIFMAPPGSLCQLLEANRMINRRNLALVAFVVAVLTGCASGSAVVTGTPRASTTAEQVKLYLDEPSDFEVIGLVTASSDGGWSEQDSVNYAVEELKKQAARLGANGLLLDPKIDSSTTMGRSIPVTTKTVQGRAIFVKKD